MVPKRVNRAVSIVLSAVLMVPSIGLALLGSPFHAVLVCIFLSILPGSLMLTLAPGSAVKYSLMGITVYLTYLVTVIPRIPI